MRADGSPDWALHVCQRMRGILDCGSGARRNRPGRSQGLFGRAGPEGMRWDGAFRNRRSCTFLKIIHAQSQGPEETSVLSRSNSGRGGCSFRACLGSNFQSRHCELNERPIINLFHLQPREFLLSHSFSTTCKRPLSTSRSCRIQLVSTFILVG